MSKVRRIRSDFYLSLDKWSFQAARSALSTIKSSSQSCHAIWLKWLWTTISHKEKAAVATAVAVAKEIYKKLMVLAPGSVGPDIDYASCLIYERKYVEPVKILKEVLKKKPNNNIARTNLAMVYLFNKKFKDGWKYSDARILLTNQFDVTKRYDKLKSFFDIDVDKKELKANEKIIILLDAGLGDAILGLSMLKEFHNKFKNISAEVDYRLVNLCKRSFPGINFYAVRENRHEFIIDYDLSLFDKGFIV